MDDEILAESKKFMQKAVEAFQHEITTVRTGRANASLLDGIRVDYYGSQVPINQLASVNVPEARMLTVQPWDKGAMPHIEKAIQASNLGLMPSNDGNLIRLPIPALTEERRNELVRVVRHMAEECKVSIRNARRDANELLKDGQKEGEIPEDQAKRAQDQVQKQTDEFVTRIDALLSNKEEEIMEV
ncbi:MAG: ribosome recycling factor [bacterium]|nr:ribosome recycling factor [bacterium]